MAVLKSILILCAVKYGYNADSVNNIRDVDARVIKCERVVSDCTFPRYQQDFGSDVNVCLANEGVAPVNQTRLVALIKPRAKAKPKHKTMVCGPSIMGKLCYLAAR